MTQEKHSENKTVLTYGTFDLFHYGHLRLLQRAKKLGTKLIVYLSTDKFNAKKGKRAIDTYPVRKKNILDTGLVDKVLPERRWEQKASNMELYTNPVLVMGDDWKGKFDYLSLCGEVVYLPRTPNISSTKLKDERSRKRSTEISQRSQRRQGTRVGRQ